MFDGGYHGHIDETLYGEGDAAYLGLAPPSRRATGVVQFNDPDAVEALLAAGDVACVVTEPALTNVGLLLPVAGFHVALRELTRRRPMPPGLSTSS